MDFEKFFDELYLHDSVVNNCQYLSNKKQLVLNLELCNYMQDSYQKNDSEIVNGQLLFDGVTKFISQPSTEHIQWGEEMNGQIFDVTVLSKLEFLSEIEIIMEISDYINNIDDIYKLNILAKTVKWIPLV